MKIAIVDYSMGKTPPRKETEYRSNGTIPWVSIADLVADGTVTATKECVNNFAGENTFKGKISKAGTLLMSFKLTVGKVSILGIDAFHNEAIISIYPFVEPDKITTMFLFAALPLLSQSGDTKSAIKGNTLNSDSLDALLIPLPPIMEQKRIFDKLHELTTPLLDYGAAGQKVTDLNANFPEALKKSILQEAVQVSWYHKTRLTSPQRLCWSVSGRRNSSSSRKVKSKRISTNLSFSGGIIHIMKSGVPKRSVSTRRYRLKYPKTGLGAGLPA